MSRIDKLKNDSEHAKGKTKEAIGDLTDDASLEAEGRKDQAKADVKNAGESLKEAGRKAKDAVSD